MRVKVEGDGEGEGEGEGEDNTVSRVHYSMLFYTCVGVRCTCLLPIIP